MHDGNLKAWVLGFLVVVGLSFEVLKHLPGRQGEFGAEVIRLVDEITPPYNVKKILPHFGKRSTREPQPQNVGSGTLAKFVAANTPQETTLGQDKDQAAKSENAGNSKDGKKKLEKCDEENPKLDPQTGQPVPCRKKKKKKTDEEKTANANPQPIQPSSDNSNAHRPTESYVMYAPALPVQKPTGTGGSPAANNTINSLQEWQQRLLTTPNPAETKAFIQAYRSNLVTADIFYKITEMMLKDQRSDMQLLGIDCASASQNLVSFQLLAAADAAAADGSNVKSHADSALAVYSQLKNLTILQRVLSSSVQNQTTVLATQMLDAAAKTYLNPSSTSVPTTDPSGSSTTKNAPYFKPFIPILNTLVRSTNSQVAYQATQTLNLLESLLANLGNPVV